MSEKKSQEPQKKELNPFKWLKEYLSKRKERKAEEFSENEARAVAEWALLEFTSGEIQAPRRSIVANQYKDQVTFAEITNSKKATIFRIHGSVYHREKKIFWFVAVTDKQEARVFGISDGHQTHEKLAPVTEGYALASNRKVELRQEIPINFLLNWLIHYPFDDQMGQTDKIEIMFAGSPEKAPQAQSAPELIPVKIEVNA